MRNESRTLRVIGLVCNKEELNGKIVINSKLLAKVKLREELESIKKQLEEKERNAKFTLKIDATKKSSRIAEEK